MRCYLTNTVYCNSALHTPMKDNVGDFCFLPNFITFYKIKMDRIEE